MARPGNAWHGRQGNAGHGAARLGLPGTGDVWQATHGAAGSDLARRKGVAGNVGHGMAGNGGEMYGRRGGA